MGSKKRSKVRKAQTVNKPVLLKTRLSKRNASERYMRAASRTEARERYEHLKNSPSVSTKCQGRAKRSLSVESTSPEMHQTKRKRTEEASGCKGDDGKQEKCSLTKKPQVEPCPSGTSSEQQPKDGLKRKISPPEEKLLPHAESESKAKSLRTRESRESTLGEGTMARKGSEASGSSLHGLPKSNKSNPGENGPQNNSSPGPKNKRRGKKTKVSHRDSLLDEQDSVKMRDSEENAEKIVETVALEENQNEVKDTVKETDKSAEDFTTKVASQSTAEDTVTQAEKNIKKKSQKSPNKVQVKLKKETNREKTKEMDVTNNNGENSAGKEANKNTEEVTITKKRGNKVGNAMDERNRITEKNAIKEADKGSERDAVVIAKEDASKTCKENAVKESREYKKTDEVIVCETSKFSGDETGHDIPDQTQCVSNTFQAEEQSVTKESQENETHIVRMPLEGSESNFDDSISKGNRKEPEECQHFPIDKEDSSSVAREVCMAGNKNAENGDQDVLVVEGSNRKDTITEISVKKSESNQPCAHNPKSNSNEDMGVPPECTVQNKDESTSVTEKQEEVTVQSTQEHKGVSANKEDKDTGTSSISEKSAAATQSTSESINVAKVNKCLPMPGQPGASVPNRKKLPLLETPPVPAEEKFTLKKVVLVFDQQDSKLGDIHLQHVSVLYRNCLDFCLIEAIGTCKSYTKGTLFVMMSGVNKYPYLLDMSILLRKCGEIQYWARSDALNQGFSEWCSLEKTRKPQYASNVTSSNVLLVATAAGSAPIDSTGKIPTNTTTPVATNKKELIGPNPDKKEIYSSEKKPATSMAVFNAGDCVGKTPITSSSTEKTEITTTNSYNKKSTCETPLIVTASTNKSAATTIASTNKTPFTTLAATCKIKPSTPDTTPTNKTPATTVASTNKTLSTSASTISTSKTPAANSSFAKQDTNYNSSFYKQDTNYNSSSFL
ncbi:uncharacterized protein LOC122256340 [Penaeus japonicus]|uniref:uncharacterized protein LOC122256340 n=1 Tax=Penaeus japonicus TaxID=27405 RepID=UPI001C70E7D6|nr:uncharacterized protein LOC122256340 [Penaeus japonicus]